MSDLNEFDSPLDAELDSKTDSQVAEELRALELEEKRLDLELKREQVKKNRDQQSARLEQARMKLLTTKQFLAQRAASQKACNHRKGGRGAEGVIRGQGTDAMYSIFKHRLPNGKYFVLCSRCGAEWHPADNLNVDLGHISPRPATEGYKEAIDWPTDNSPSTSSTFLIQREADNAV